MTSKEGLQEVSWRREYTQGREPSRDRLSTALRQRNLMFPVNPQGKDKDQGVATAGRGSLVCSKKEFGMPGPSGCGHQSSSSSAWSGFLAGVP